MKRVPLILLSIVLIGVLAVGGLTADKQPIKIGVVLPMSPPGAYNTGTKMYRAVQLAVKEINEAGGIFGGRKVEAILADTQGMPEVGKAAVERLITKNKVVGIIGNYHSGVALAELPLLDQYHVPYISAETWDDRVTAKGYDEVFRISITSSMYSKIAVDWMVAAGFKNVQLLHENTSYGLWIKDYLNKELDKTNIQYQTVLADPKTEDFTSTLLNIKMRKPDLFFGDVTGPGAFRLMKQAYNVGLAPTPDTVFYGSTSLLNHKEFWESVGEAGKYTVVTRTSLPPTGYNELTKRVTKKYEETYNKTMTPEAMEGYDALMLMVEAIKYLGSTDADSIIQALETMRWTGLRGEYFFPYGSKNPVPEGKPDYMWHQFPNVSAYLLEYTEVGQKPTEAPVIWPPRWASEEVGPSHYIQVPEK